MRISPAIPCLVLTAAVLVSCGEQAPTNAVDPEVGRACFDTHIAALPTGTQYEGTSTPWNGRA
jgi:hypothetical protein